jgi:hypothetical protein
LLLNKIHTTLIFLLLLGSLNTWAQKIEGRIIDKKSGEPLPLVNIVYNQQQRLGTTTDFDGYFTLPSYREVYKEIQISFIGYQTLTIPKSDIPRNGKDWVIKLESSVNALDEIDLVAKENPALRIIRNAIANRKLNNPKNYESYTYVSYNKDIITYKAIEQ